MRVVADTNTLVSAFLWGGAPAEVLTAAREQRLSLFISATLIAELEDVLAREKFVERITHVGSTVTDLLAGYRALAQIVRTTEMAPVSRDPDDDHVLACALAADAHRIVTRDQDLRTLDPFRIIRILPACRAAHRNTRLTDSGRYGHFLHESSWGPSTSSTTVTFDHRRRQFDHWRCDLVETNPAPVAAVRSSRSAAEHRTALRCRDASGAHREALWN